MNNTLLGKWKIDPDDIYSVEWYGNIAYEFLPEGKLVHTIENADRVQTINMEYAVEANVLVLSRPSSEAKEQVAFTFLPGGKLELQINNVASRFVRSAG